MPWPTPQDFNEAIQNPATAFGDPELKTGQPQLSRLGLPVARSGAFASVYRMQCGTRAWAVRCFLRELRDHQERYAAISDHLRASNLPYTVGFTFLPQGIRLGRNWYPILKMEWVQGEALDAYVERHLGQPAVLLALAERWARMMGTLAQAGIAHGDLQHGNVLVLNGDLKLIDYDGMFVPRLAGRKSNELGHRNYQHPQRTESDYGPYLDHFSAWIIYVSLLALSIDPGLWDEFRGENESLLFKREDFERPAASAAFRTVERLLRGRYRPIAELLKTLPTSGLRTIPPLDGTGVVRTEPIGAGWLTDHRPAVPPPRPTVVVPPPPPPPASRPVGAPTATVAVMPPESAGAPPPAGSPPTPAPFWLLDHVEAKQTPTARFVLSPWPERVVFPLSVAAACLPIATRDVPLSWALAAALAANLATWMLRYQSDAGVRERSRLRRRMADLADTAAATEQNIATSEKLRGLRLTHQHDTLAQLNARYQELLAANKAEFAVLQNTFRKVTFTCNARRQVAAREEVQALRDLNERPARIKSDLAALDTEESAELAAARDAWQARQVTDYLRRFRIEEAPLPGIGDQLKMQLFAGGICTAEDIQFVKVQQVPGIGPARAAQLTAWRKDLEDQALRAKSATLPADQVDAVRRRFQQKRGLLLAELRLLRERRSAEEALIQERFDRLRAALRDEEDAARERFDRESEQLRERYAREYQAVQDRAAAVKQETRDVLAGIDRDISEARRAIFSMQWEREKLQRDEKLLAGLSFGAYVRRLLGLA